MKRTIEIEDNLSELVENCKDELLNDFRSYLEDNSDVEDFDTYYQAQGADQLHEISDSSTPIYYNEIDGLYFLHGNDFDEAYNNTGIGDGSEDNHRQVAIWCYLNQETGDFLCDLRTWFEDKILELSDLNNEQVRKAVLLDSVNELETENI